MFILASVNVFPSTDPIFSDIQHFFKKDRKHTRNIKKIKDFRVLDAMPLQLPLVTYKLPNNNKLNHQSVYLGSSYMKSIE